MVQNILKCALLSTAVMATSVLADDTDIYLNPGFNEGSEPLVMFSLDLRSNTTSTYAGCSRVGGAGTYCAPARFFAESGLAAKLPGANSPLTFFDALRLALELALRPLEAEMKIGLMINNGYNNNCEGPGRTRCSNGGYMLRGFRSLLEAGALDEFIGKLDTLRRYAPDGNALGSNTFNGHPYQGKELFFEFYRYLTGGAVYNGHNGSANFNSPTQNNRLYNTSIPLDSPNKFPASALDANNRPILAWDRRIENAAGTQYVSPISLQSNCTSIYTINFFFGNTQQEDNSDAALTAPVANGGMGFAQRGVSRPSFNGVLEYLRDVDIRPDVDGRQTVKSYFVFDGQQSNSVNSYARSGGTDSAYLISEDPEALVETLQGILREILSVSTTFVSASVPVNVFNRAEIVDNVYLALFQAEREPRWAGNVKKLLLDQRTDAAGAQQSFLIDADAQGAVAGDGRIRFDALTYWTNPAGRDLTAPTNVDEGLFFGRDGRHVRRGGAGQQIPGFLGSDPGLTNATAGARTLYYANGGTLAALNATPAVASALTGPLGTTGAADPAAEALRLLRYIRGYDVAPTAAAGAVRDWWMGDPMHSRPLPINYGQLGAYGRDNQAIYVAFGSNDGFFRMVRNTLPGNTIVQDGREVWAFMPQEVMGIQKQLSNNTDSDDLPAHPYGVDGAPASLSLNVDPATGVPGQVLVFFGLRRGGSAYYALDVTNPEVPSLAWRINASTPGFSRLAKSFSRPQVGRVRQNGTVVPVVIFSGGYNINKDYYTPPQPKSLGSNDSSGNVIYVVNAQTGALIWEGLHPNLVDSIPSDVTVADTSGDGLIDRVLFGDTGGNIWRADLPGDNVANWGLHKLAALGRHAGTANRLNDRRFFHAPDLIQTKNNQGTPYDAVVIGSGDRENPLDRFDGTPTENWLYVLRDYNVGVQGPAERAAITPILHSALDDITDCVPFDACQDQNLTLDDGWRMQFEIAPGEKNLSSPFTFLGTIFLTTYLPPNNQVQALTCGPQEGSGALYAVRLEDGTPRFNFDQADDAEVGEDDIAATTKTDRHRLLASGGIPSEVVYIGGGNLLLGDLSIISAGAEPRLPTFWRRNELSDRSIITVNDAPAEEEAP